MMGSRASRTAAPDASQRAALNRQKLQEVDNALAELNDVPEQAAAAARSGAAAVTVVIGNSEMAQRGGFVTSIVSMVNRSYGCMRVDEDDVMDRLAMGDAGSGRGNRVLHLAMLEDGRPVGCMSSTFKVPWAESGCGHWGLLVVDVGMQGQGIASAMISAAERRLGGMCNQIQIEYEYTPGDELSERLLAWYEGKCGFKCVSGRPRGRGTEFRKCRKMIPENLQRLGERDRLREIRSALASDLQSLEAEMAE